MTRSPIRVMHLVVAGEIGGAERMLVDLACTPNDCGLAVLSELFA